MGDDLLIIQAEVFLRTTMVFMMIYFYVGLSGSQLQSEDNRLLVYGSGLSRHVEMLFTKSLRFAGVCGRSQYMYLFSI